jgi:hypothetical protein
MDNEDAWRIIELNLLKLVDVMVALKKGTSIDVFCNQDGSQLSFSNPSAQANLKLCRMNAPDLEGTYDIHQEGSFFVNGGGERIPRDKFPGYLTQCIRDMKDGGAEWGWEFNT